MIDYLAELTFGLLAIATPAAQLPLEPQNYLDQPASPTSTSTRIAAAPSTSGLEQSVYTQINQYRTSQGLSPLTLDARIAQQARTHSQNMAAGRVSFGHQGFQQRVQVIAQAIPVAGAAENVAYNQGSTNPAGQAVQSWLQSSGHRGNILGSYNLTGVGVAKSSNGRYYFTQIFIRSR
jgi:uncharacterized protein YkwD